MADSFDHHIAQAVALLQSGDHDGAIGLLRQLLVSAPGDHRVLFVMGEALRHGGKNLAAEANFERTLRLVTVDNGDIFYRLGLSRFAAGLLDAARAAFAAAAERLPESSDVWLSLGTTALGLNDQTLAEQALRKANLQDPASVEILVNLAELLSRQNRPIESLAAFKSALELAPDRLDLAERVLTGHLDVGDGEGGAAYMRRFIERFPGRPQSFYMLGWLYHTTSRHADAAAAYRAAVLLRPDWAEYVASLGGVMRSIGADTDSQKRVFRQATILDGNSLTAVLGMARAHLDQGDFEAARRLVEDFDQRCAYPRGPRRSVIIPVLNYSPGSPHNIRTLLEDLRDFDGEVICIFNGDEVYQDLRDHPRIDKFSYNKFNVGVARGWNMGINQAEGDTIHVLNADLKVSVEMLYRLEEWLHSLPDAVCVGVSAHWIDPRTLEEVKSFNSHTFTQPLEADSVSGQLFSLHAKRLHDAGITFDPRLSPYFGEEADLFIKARASGLKIYAVPETDFEHSWGISVRDRPILYLTRLVHRTHHMINNQILLQDKARRLIS